MVPHAILENALPNRQVVRSRRDDRDRFAGDDRASNRTVLCPDRSTSWRLRVGCGRRQELWNSVEPNSASSTCTLGKVIAARERSPVEPPVELTEVQASSMALLARPSRPAHARAALPDSRELVHLYSMTVVSSRDRAPSFCVNRYGRTSAKLATYARLPRRSTYPSDRALDRFAHEVRSP